MFQRGCIVQLDNTGLTGSGQGAGPIAAAWAASAPRLAAHFFALQNRTDVHGRYVSPERRKPGAKSGKPVVAFTAHVVLTVAMLVRHFIGQCRGDLVGLHVSSPAETCKWIVVDFDAHGDGDDPEANWTMALAVHLAAKTLGFDVLLLDSNGAGGLHVWIIFANAVPMADAWRLGRWLVRDYAAFGLSRAPETFPKARRLTGKRIGGLVRLPGLHHTRDHWTRAWDGQRWLEGEEAIRAILAVKGRDVDLAALIPADFEPHKRRQIIRRLDLASGPAPAPSGRRIATARDALRYLGENYHGNYDWWMKVGLMLRELGDAGLTLWHEWSESCPKYRAEALGEKWADFASGDEGPAGRPITLGSLFYLAREEGWPGPSGGTKAKSKVCGTFTTPIRPLDQSKEARR
jgi:hypothetical protein